ncbi:hypothetical protein PTKIN_Ptkin05aG0115300 [Pterospermum kingtungense]
MPRRMMMLLVILSICILFHNLSLACIEVQSSPSLLKMFDILILSGNNVCNDDDMHFIIENGPWSFDGALIAMLQWQPNTDFNLMSFQEISLWVQLWGLPLEYHISDILTRLAQVVGPVEQLDWSEVFHTNVRYAHVPV